MAYKHDTTRKYESVQCPGVVFYLNKMTEGRRLNLRSRLAEANRRIRDILREQDSILKTPEDSRDYPKYMELQDELDGIVLEKIDPEWILWGVKQIEGLESDGKPLTTAEWRDWPSALFKEVLDSIKSEAELSGTQRKNLELPTTSGGQGDSAPLPLTATTVEEKVIGETEIALSTIPTE